MYVSSQAAWRATLLLKQYIHAYTHTHTHTHTHMYCYNTQYMHTVTIQQNTIDNTHNNMVHTINTLYAHETTCKKSHTFTHIPYKCMHTQESYTHVPQYSIHTYRVVRTDVINLTRVRRQASASVVRYTRKRLRFRLRYKCGKAFSLVARASGFTLSALDQPLSLSRSVSPYTNHDLMHSGIQDLSGLAIKQYVPRTGKWTTSTRELSFLFWAIRN